MLRKIRVKRFKSIEDTEIELGKVTILIGPNNAGKSSFLQAAQFAVSMGQSLALTGLKWNRSGILAGTLGVPELIYSPLRDVHALATGGQLKQATASRIEVTFTDEAGEHAITTVHRGKNKNVIARISGEPLGVKITPILQPFSVFSPGLAGIPAWEEFKSPGIVRRAASRGDANSVFRNVLWILKQDRIAWNQFSQDLAELFPGVKVDIDFEMSTDEFLNATVTKGSTTLPIDAAGTGILQAIQVLSYIGVYEPRLLILDEPDSHLHPDNQRTLLQLLTKLAEQNDFQVLMSTHSRHILDEAQTLGSQVVWLGAGKVEEGYDDVAGLMELGALDAGDRLRSDETKIIVITEDSRTKNLEAIIESSGFSRDDYALWSYKGCSQIASAVTLANYIHKQSPETKVVVHRDRDYLDDTEIDTFIRSIEEASAMPFMTTGTDIESHFLDSKYLASVCTNFSVIDFDDKINAATKTVEAESMRRLINEVFSFQLKQPRGPGDPVPKAGRAAEIASERYHSNPVRYRHGKFTLKAVREEARPTAINLEKSPLLAVEPFVSLAKGTLPES